MRLIVMPLAMLLVIAFISQAVAISNFQNPFVNETITLGNQTGTVNGTELEIEGFTVDAGFDLEMGVIAFVIAMIGVGAVAGISVLGSGLNEASTRIIYKSLAYFGLWAIISAFALTSITSIQYFGWILYFTLTFIYGLGIFEGV